MIWWLNLTLFGIAFGASAYITFRLVFHFVKNRNSIIGTRTSNLDLDEINTHIMPCAVNVETGEKFIPPTTRIEALQAFFRLRKWREDNYIETKGKPIYKSRLIIDTELVINYLHYPDGKLAFDPESPGARSIEGSKDRVMGLGIERAIDNLPPDDEKNRAEREKQKSYIKVLKEKANQLVKKLQLEQDYSSMLEIMAEEIGKAYARQFLKMKREKQWKTAGMPSKKDLLKQIGWSDDDIDSLLPEDTDALDELALQKTLMQRLPDGLQESVSKQVEARMKKKKGDADDSG